MIIPVKTAVILSLLYGVTAFNAYADDNIAACEVVVQQPVSSLDDVKETDMEETDMEETPMIATFIPADDFIYSVFDGEEGHMTDIDGHLIQALMCKRKYLVPTEFDLRLIETHIPLYLSQNFDSTESDLMAVYFKTGKYEYQYSGNDLDKDTLELLDVRMTTLNSDVKNK